MCVGLIRTCLSMNTTFMHVSVDKEACFNLLLHLKQMQELKPRLDARARNYDRYSELSTPLTFQY